MTLTRAQVEAALIPRPAKAGPVSLLAGVVTGDRMVDLGDGPLIVDGPTGPVGQEGYVLNVDGHRMWLPFDGASPSHLAAIAALTSRVAALETAGPWVDCAPASGFIGTLRVRTLGPLLTEVDCNLTGTVPVGATELTAAIPATHRPASGTHRIEGSANNFPVGGYAGSSGQLGVIQQTGASRTGVAMRGTWSRV